MKSFILIVLFIAFLYLVYLYFRNIKVRDFFININHTITINLLTKLNNNNYDSYKFKEIERKIDAIFEKYPYEKILFSFKRLKLEKYYTKEEIDIIKGNYEI